MAAMTRLPQNLRTIRSGARVARAPAVFQPAQPRSVAARSASSAPVEQDVNFEELAEIIKLVSSTDIIEMEWKGKKFNLTVRKSEALKAAEPVYQVISAPAGYAPAPAAAAPAPAAPAPAPVAPAPAPPAAAPKAAAPPVTGGIEIQSPMSGTFYTAAAPGEPPFVKVGDRIKKGQTVGIVEAMKLMNEIEAEVSGEVVKLMIENGKPITAGQPLMVIRP